MISLRAGSMLVTVDPTLGGSIVRAEHGGKALLRGNLDACDPREGGCFPLTPFCGLLPEQGFFWQGGLVKPKPNLLNFKVAVHGYAWLNPWRVDRQLNNELTLTQLYQATDWPWDYSVKQCIKLHHDSFEQSIEVKNLSQETAPVGLGLHPYFPICKDSVFQSPDTEYSNGVSADQLTFDRGIRNWTGSARLRTENHQVALTAVSSTKCFLALYRPEGAPYLCLEPMTQRLDSATPDDIEQGFDTLQAGEVLTLSMTVKVLG